MGLYKRNRVWWMTYTVRGRQVRVSTGCRNRQLAEDILAKQRTNLIEGRYFDLLEEKTRTGRELIERWLSEHAPKLAPTPSYENFSRNRLIPFFGDMLLADITPKVIIEYKTIRRSQGMKPATINREMALLRGAFSLAVKEWEWCRTNPFSKVREEVENNARDRWLRDEEEIVLLQHCPDWLREIVIFALETGLRQGEILNLTWEAVDLKREMLTVMKSKNGTRRGIPLSQRALDLLRNKIKVRSIQTTLVFHSREHTAYSSGNIERAWGRVRANAKLVDLRFHDLRHTFATRLVQAGEQLYAVSQLLGHKTLAMTQRYAHHCPESLRSTIQALDRRTGITVSSQPDGMASLAAAN